MAKYWYYLKSIFELIMGFKRPWQIISAFISSSGLKRQTVTLRHPPVSMIVRGKMDIWSIKETFIDRFYAKYGCNVGEDWTIVDIGAAIGEFTIYIATSRPKVKIFAYEPFRDSVEILKANLSLNEVNNVVLYPLAVWNTATTLTLDMSQQEPLMITSKSSSLMDDDHYRVNAISLADVLLMNKLESVDLLKMDCEGAEFDILLGSDAAIITAFKRIVMEYHDGVGDRHHTQIISLLGRLGYRVSFQKNVVHPEIGYLYADLV